MDTEFVVSGIARAHYLESHGSGLRLRGDIEVHIGGQRARLVGSAPTGLLVRLDTALAVGWHTMDVYAPDLGEASVSNALEVRDVDGGRGMDGGGVEHHSGPDGGIADAAARDAGSVDAALRDAGADGGLLDAGLPAAECDPADVTLALCLDFDGDFTDRSRYGNHASGSGATFVSGVFGQALSVDPTSSCSVPSSASLSSPSGLTLAMWIRPASLPSDGERMALIDKEGQFGLFLRSDGFLECATGGARPRGALPVGGEWVHVACTRNVSQTRLYIDGALVDETSTAMALTSGSHPLMIGQDSPSGGDAFEGLIDRMRLYGRSMEVVEVLQLARR